MNAAEGQGTRVTRSWSGRETSQQRAVRLAAPYALIVPAAMMAILMFPLFPDGAPGVPNRLVFCAMVPFGGLFGYLVALLDRGTWR